MAIHWDDIRTIGVMVRTGSLSATGQELGLNYTTVARRIVRAEAALGETLFERMSDGYRPTEAAHLIANHAAAMQSEEDAMMRQLTGRSREVSGPLIVTAPQLLIALELAPVLAKFSDHYPRIDLTVLATNEILDLTRREADMAIRISRAPGDALKGLRLTEQHSASFASPDWAARIAADPTGPIDWVVYDRFATLPADVLRSHPGSRVRFRFDDMVAMIGAAQAGLGVVRCPMFLGRGSKGLLQVPIGQPQPYADIWAVAHADVWPSARVRAFRDCLVPHIRSRRPVFCA